MSDSDVTLKSILSIEATDLPPAIAAALESTDALSVVKKQILDDVAELKFDSILGVIVDKIAGMLDMSLSEIMVTAWKKYELLAGCLDEDKYSADESILVTLTRHSLTSEHHPSIEILANDQEIGKLTFSIKLSLHVRGAVLKIQDKKVREIRHGEVSGDGSFKCGDYEIASREFDPKTIPGSISLNPGIDIPAIGLATET
jgi:hypothetical protein